MELHIDTGQFTINQLRHLGEKKFPYNEMYQRTEVWNKSQKRRLVDSILRGYTMGMLILRREGKKYEVLDGQQRLRTLFQFFRGRFTDGGVFTTDEVSPLGKITFKDLHGKRKYINQYTNFLAFQIPYTLIECPEEQIVADIFTRLQEGVRLNTAEKLHAYTVAGEMKKFVVDIADRHPLFKKVGISSRRFAHREICANIALFELKGDLDRLDFPSFRFLPLAEMYRVYERKLPKKRKKNIKGALNFLNKVLKDDAQMIIDKGNFIHFYILASHLHKRYVFKKRNYPQFRKFLMEFLVKVKNIKEEEKDVYSKDPYIQYAARTAGTLENMQERFRILSREFFNVFPSLRLKDEKRGFDIGQKIAIYFRDKGRCLFCRSKRRIKWRDAEFHHVKPHGEGGPTVIPNGKLAHKSCHEKFHRKTGKNE